MNTISLLQGLFECSKQLAILIFCVLLFCVLFLFSHSEWAASYIFWSWPCLAITPPSVMVAQILTDNLIKECAARTKAVIYLSCRLIWHQRGAWQSRIISLGTITCRILTTILFIQLEGFHEAPSCFPSSPTECISFLESVILFPLGWLIPLVGIPTLNNLLFFVFSCICNIWRYSE